MQYIEAVFFEMEYLSAIQYENAQNAQVHFILKIIPQSKSHFGAFVKQGIHCRKIV